MSTGQAHDGLVDWATRALERGALTDSRLRELEREWRRVGSIEAEAAYLVERVRIGDLDDVTLDRAAPFSPAAQLALGSLKLITPRVKGGKRRRRGRLTRSEKVQPIQAGTLRLGDAAHEDHVRVAVAAVIAASTVQVLSREPLLRQDLPSILPSLVALVEAPLPERLEQISRRTAAQDGDLAACVRSACAAIARSGGLHDPAGLEGSIWEDAMNALARGARAVGDQTEEVFSRRVCEVMARWLLTDDPLNERTLGEEV